MKPKNPIVPLPILIFSLLGLWRFSEDVRAVNVVGLYASGVAAGATLVWLVIYLRSKREP